MKAAYSMLIVQERLLARQLKKVRKRFEKAHRRLMGSRKPPAGSRAKTYLALSRRVEMLEKQHLEMLRKLVRIRRSRV